MTVLGHGVDIVRIERFLRLLGKNPSGAYVKRLTRRIMHEVHEVPHFEALRAAGRFEKSVVYLAGTWAIKEAIYKSIDDADQKMFQFNRWYRVYGSRGQPIVGSDDFDENEQFLVSVSHDGGTLIASVIRQQMKECS